MKLADFIDEGLICCNIKPESKSILLENLSKRICQKYSEINETSLLENLLKREEENSTGIGNSIAIPHCIEEKINKTICLIAQIPDGVDFDAMDDKKVKIVFLLISPPLRMSEHIRLLARITRIIKDRNVVTSLIDSKTNQEILNILLQEDGRHV
ncbi:MAG: hypothetical protein COA79_03985 [Planctomycetota bacterium]|nr:MAG: hypothetical protein COA79_03985 [Planctomycetota bacterium]